MSIYYMEVTTPVGVFTTRPQEMSAEEIAKAIQWIGTTVRDGGYIVLDGRNGDPVVIPDQLLRNSAVRFVEAL